MRSLDSIRGKKPTKTEQILEYMLCHPHKVITPTDVAEDLDFNVATTTTLLNRLALEGTISKRGRGQFLYEGENGSVVRRRISQSGTKIKVDEALPHNIDDQSALKIFNFIYKMACESAGPGFIKHVTGIDQDDVHENAPEDSLRNLIRALNDLLGEDVVRDMVSIALARVPINKRRNDEDG